MKKATISSTASILHKLEAVKLLKEITNLGLKESKRIIDYISEHKNKTYDIEIRDEIFNKYQKIYTKAFSDIDIKVDFKSREEKIKRLLYFDQETLIKDMLHEMTNWEKFVDEESLQTLPYSKCKEIAIDNIINKYKKYIKNDSFNQLNLDIKRINKIESKDVGAKFIKFNEEFGEFSAEYLKLKGLSPKSYEKENLIEEMADSLQVLLSIFNHIGDEADIKISDILDKILEKNKKWEKMINNYKIKKQ